MSEHDARSGLSPREVEVLVLIGRGLTNQEIAAELSLGLNTVKTYIRTAYRRIGVESRARAIIWTFTHGLVAVQGVGTPAPRPGASTVR